MSEADLKKVKLFNELILKVEKFKKNADKLHKFSEDIFVPLKESVDEGEEIDLLQKQNDKVFNINMYILVKLYTKEYREIRRKKGKFTLEEYYEFIETIGLNDKVDTFYSRMPSMIAKNQILSYVTDNPSFMSMIR